MLIIVKVIRFIDFVKVKVLKNIIYYLKLIILLFDRNYLTCHTPLYIKMNHLYFEYVFFFFFFRAILENTLCIALVATCQQEKKEASKFKCTTKSTQV